MGPAVSLAVVRYQELQQTAGNVDALKQQLTGRDLVAKAKRILIEQGLTEDEAYHVLQAEARKRQINLAEMARRIINQS